MKHLKRSVRQFYFTAVWLLLFTACNTTETRQPEKATPRVFIPADSSETAAAPAQETATAPEEPVTLTREIEKPDLKKLGQLTPNQEAKRALTNDAYKATKMDLDTFGKFMESRIPYYKNKGNLKFENDIVRINITAKEMVIQTMKGRLTYPMQ